MIGTKGLSELVMAGKRHICFISAGYPNSIQSHLYPFLDQLVCEIADLGVKCTVINPISLTKNFGKPIPPAQWLRKTTLGEEVEVFCPRFISYSEKKLGKINTGEWTLHAFQKAVGRVVRALQHKPDALYAHFIFPSGMAAAGLGKQHHIPVFCAVGEGKPWSINVLGAQCVAREMNENVNFLAVAGKVKKMLVEHGIGHPDEIAVFPNGVNLELFKPLDRSAMRQKYAFRQDAFIIAFVGGFVHQKGIARIIEAIQGLDGIYAVFIGKGSCESDPNTTLFKGQLAHAEVPWMLNAADIFVLPTLVEGCSNAIIEALGCGLPVVSSNYGFNDEILNEDCAIRLDPLNVSEIRQAIINLKNDPGLRARMSQAALLQASRLDIRKRAQNILAWMETRLSVQQADREKG